jgi:predicted permease
VRPALGRFYTAAEDRTGGAEPVAVVGYDFWQRTLGGDPKAVGQTLVVDSRPLTIVGVAPRGFHGAFLGTFAFNVWVPAAAYRQPSGTAIGTNAPREIWMNLFGRLRPGVDSVRASAALRVIAPRVPTADPDTHVVDAWVDPLTAQPVQKLRSVETFMAMLLAVAVIVLLIAAANAAAMLIARAAARRREVATRLAVGASRAQLVRQLLVESVLLCVAAGTVGLLLTSWLMRVLNAWQPPFPVPVAAGFSLNVVVLAVATAIMLGTGLLSGLAPALYATRVDLAAAMQEGGLRGGTHRTRLRSMFVVAQVALSVVLLAVAGLFVRSLERTLSIDPGFAAAGVVHAGVNLEPHGYDEERAHALFTQTLDRLRARPDVAMAALATNAPLSGHYSNSLARRPDRPDDQGIAVQWGTAGVGFIELLRTPRLAGRTFTRADGPGSSPVAVINETLAQRLWPGESSRQVIGHELRSLGRRMTVVGVIGNGKYTRMQEEATDFGYISLAQNFSLSPMLYVRARGTTAAAFRAMREELARLAPNVALDRPSLLTDDIGRDLVPQRIGALLVGTFGLVGLLLATTGLYGVLAFGVAQRQREFGVRIALGARIGHVVHLVVRQGLLLVGIGIALGLIGAFVAARLVSAFLYHVSPADPLTLVAVPLVLLAAALLASIIPARRAAAADPMASLRAE